MPRKASEVTRALPDIFGAEREIDAQQIGDPTAALYARLSAHRHLANATPSCPSHGDEMRHRLQSTHSLLTVAYEHGPIGYLSQRHRIRLATRCPRVHEWIPAKDPVIFGASTPNAECIIFRKPGYRRYILSDHCTRDDVGSRKPWW